MSEKEIELPEGLDVDTATDVLREYASTDEAQIVDKETMDALEADITEAKTAFASILAEDSPMSVDALSSTDMDALTEPFRDEEGDIDVDVLRQVPETEDGETDTLENDETEGFDTLGRDEIEEIETLNKKMETFESRGVDSRVDALKSEIVELAGAEEYEEVKTEVLA